MKKFVVKTDVSRCVGNARCEAVNGQMFKLDDNGYNTREIREIEASQENLEFARRAARSCPEGVITVEDV